MVDDAVTARRTVERVAVLSDIHGVLPAVEAVLAEPAVQQADAIVLTGDILAGPLPVGTLAVLRELGDRAVWVRGNADRELVEYVRTGAMATPDSMAAWAARQLRPEDLDLLDSLPPAVVLEVAGIGPTLFCHATPRDDEEVVVVDSRLERWAEV
ncbi:MAG TPA: metallophosphoesterase, partial [Actinopolymorphaceae bacterium]